MNKFDSAWTPENPENILHEIITDFKYGNHYVLYIAANALKRDIRLYIND